MLVSKEIRPTARFVQMLYDPEAWLHAYEAKVQCAGTENVGRTVTELTKSKVVAEGHESTVTGQLRTITVTVTENVDVDQLL